MKVSKMLRGRLFFWYATSLVTVTAFFYLAIHVFRLPYGNIIFFLLLLVLALEGFFIIRKMTDELVRLSSKIRSITSKNLNEKVTGIDGEDEIGEMAGFFNQLLTRLDEAFKRERQFIGDIAHELKTPLAAQRTLIEVALSKNRPKEKFRDALKESLIDNNRLSSTLKNILDLAWAEADSAELQFEKVNLSEVVAEVKDLATKMARKKQIVVKGGVEAGIFITGRKDRLLGAILNIVDNAITYTSKKGTVTISLQEKDGRVKLRVKDTGVGISEKDLPHIFERFYRGSTRRPAGRNADKSFGSGLGLAIAASTIAAHQGKVEVKSKPDKGSEFTIFLPLSFS